MIVIILMNLIIYAMMSAQIILKKYLIMILYVEKIYIAETIIIISKGQDALMIYLKDFI